MKRDMHLAAAGRIMASLKKLDLASDALCVVDGATIAGYHLGNALLHSAGVCAEDVHFNTPSKLDRPLAMLPSEIRPAFDAFAELENLRSLYVRGPHPCSEETAKLAWKHLETMVECCGRAG